MAAREKTNGKKSGVGMGYGGAGQIKSSYSNAKINKIPKHKTKMLKRNTKLNKK